MQILSTLKRLVTSPTTFQSICIIVIFGVLVYCNSLFNGFVGDDDMQILNNPAVHSITEIPQLFLESTFYNGGIVAGGLYYKPLLSATFALLYAIFGVHAMPFHVVQVMLHIANVILIFLIFRYFFTSGISLFLSLVFLVHPINSETAVYISNMQDILYFFFGSIALYLELRLKEGWKKTCYISLLLLFSLFSKETGVLFMVAIIAYKLFFYHKYMRNVVIADTIVLALYGIFRVGFAHILFEKGTGVVMHTSLSTRLNSFPSIILYYLRNALLPQDHAILQTGLMTPNTSLEFQFMLLFLCIIFIVLIWIGVLLHKHKIFYKEYFFFLSLLVIGLVFHSQIFFPLDAIAADRWFYFPFIGILGLTGTVLRVNREKLQGVPKQVLLFVALLVLSYLSIQTIQRNMLFKDNFSLLSHDIRFPTDSSLVPSLLGTTLMQNGKYKDAESYLLQAEQIDPRNAATWNGLGNLYYLTGREEKAKNAFQKSIMYGSDYQGFQNYSIFLFIYGTPKDTEQITKQGLQQFQTNGVLWQLYAMTEYELQHNKEATDAAKQAYLYTPNSETKAIYDRLSHNAPLGIQIVNLGSHKVFQICPPNCKVNPDKTFVNADMNLTFNYPNVFKLTQENPYVVTIADPEALPDNKLLIYSTTSDSTDKVKVPFQVEGHLDKTNPIPLKEFDAIQENYTDGVSLLILRQKHQTVILRIPKDSSSLDDAITEVINTIKINH